MRPHINTIDDLSTADFRWEPVIYLYCLYIVVIVVGELAGLQVASSIGAAMFLLCLFVLYWHYLFNLKPGLILFSILLCLVLTVIPIVSLDEKVMQKAYQELVKYYALNCVILMGLAMPLTPLARSRRAWLLYFTILVFLLSGWLMRPQHVSATDLLKPVMGVKGFLANGNNFAFTAMMLLFLVDYGRLGKIVGGLHLALVVFLIYLSHTSGALLSFLIGIMYRFIDRKSGIPIIAKWTLVMACIGLSIFIFVSIPPKTLEVVDATNAKVTLAVNNISRVFSDKPIDFYEMIQENGQDVTSGVWRLYHWNRILHVFRNSNLVEILFGHGIGTIDSVFGIEAHNDYIRFLFQTGLTGLLLSLFVWVMLFHRMEEQYRWVAVMIACYCMTENNYDNFLAMSLLAFCMMGVGGKSRDTARELALECNETETIDGESALIEKSCPTGT